MTHGVGDALIEAFGNRVATHTGMRFERERYAELVHAVGVLGLRDAELAAWLSRPWSPADVQLVAARLSVGETYFFREPAAFQVLERELLPPLIEQRRATTRHLRIWSAGCSTGEETYSLAIMISRLIPDHADWDISIVGTDIHAGFLERAEEGVYGDWSFRGVPHSVRDQYFEALADRRFAVKSAQKSLTRFCYANLVQGINAVDNADLILCRNVMIYFGRDEALATVRHLRSSLADDGLLLVGPTEAVGGGALYEGFGEVRFEGGLFYRKQGPSELAPASNLSSPGDQPSTLPSRRNARPVARHEHPARLTSPHERRLTQALARCEGALIRDKCDSSLHVRHARLLEAAMQPDKAREALRRALFLDPTLVAARSTLDRLNRRADPASPARSSARACASPCEHSSQPSRRKYGVAA